MAKPTKKKTATKKAARKPATSAKASKSKTPAKKAKDKAKPEGPFEVELDRKEPKGLFAHMWEARRGLAASFEAQQKQGVTEERLLAYVAFACLMAFVARIPAVLSTVEAAAGDVTVPGLVAGTFVAFVIFAPLFLYGLAGVSHAVSSWAFGGQGTYRLARLALFWALVLVVPIGLVWAAVVQALTLTGFASLVEPLGLLVFAFWLWIWTSFLALAEGFSRMKCFLFVLMSLACLTGLTMLATS